jgi:hypothetical protein
MRQQTDDHPAAGRQDDQPNDQRHGHQAAELDREDSTSPVPERICSLTHFIKLNGARPYLRIRTGDQAEGCTSSAMAAGSSQAGQRPPAPTRWQKV